ncbi:MAG: helix-turn-helix domain-containing protein [Halovenus sp.]
MTEDGDVPDDALDDIAYLARSENRVRVLRALTETATKPGHQTPGYDRRDLADATGASRTTLGRILTEFEERGWAERNTSGEYVATPRGEHVAAAFDPFARSMETIRDLGDAVAVLPTGELSLGPDEEIPIGVHHFEDATVRRPESYDPTFFGRYFADLVADAEEIYSVDYVATPEKMMAAIEDELYSSGLVTKTVFAETLISHFRDHPGVGPNPEHLEFDGVEIYRYDGHVPCNVFVVDGTVLLENSQVEEIPDGTIIESRDDVVREWAIAVIERYVAASERVHPEDLA